ncbi:MAG: hypothetical protein WCG34_08785 [Leptolinea sp.]
MKESLFGHLAYRFSSSPENLATEGLSFVLNRSQVGRESFASLFNHAHVPLPSNLKFDSQDHNEQDPSIPDLVGKDENGIGIFLGEAKFWAGLTDHQPVTYLQRLIKSNGTALVFIAPSSQFATLWPELQRRCTLAWIQLENQPAENPEIQVARIQPACFLMLLSWRVILDTMQHALITHHEIEMSGNIVQLQGLCSQMDETAFLPLQSEELTSNVSRRYIQYCDLVDEATEKLVAEKFASVRGYKATGTRSGYIRYMKMHQQAVSLEFNAELWSKYRATPIWLGIRSATWNYDPQVKKHLASLESEQPPRLFRYDDALYVPIFLKTGVEKSEVVNHILAQIKEVFALLVVKP